MLGLPLSPRGWWRRVWNSERLAACGPILWWRIAACCPRKNVHLAQVLFICHSHNRHVFRNPQPQSPAGSGQGARHIIIRIYDSHRQRLKALQPAAEGLPFYGRDTFSGHNCSGVHHLPVLKHLGFPRIELRRSTTDSLLPNGRIL